MVLSPRQQSIKTQLYDMLQALRAGGRRATGAEDIMEQIVEKVDQIVEGELTGKGIKK